MNARQSGVRRATGRERQEWFALLDEWGGGGRPYREIADWLTGEHGLSAWWAQKLIVEYEEARGLRDPGVRPDGTFEVGASKTVAVPVERLFAAFVDAKLRARWLPGTRLREVAAERSESARFEWGGDGSKVVAQFTRGGAGAAKSQVSVLHRRLSDARSASEMKAFWRERLVALKAMLEGGPDR